MTVAWRSPKQAAASLPETHRLSTARQSRSPTSFTPSSCFRRRPLSRVGWFGLPSHLGLTPQALFCRPSGAGFVRRGKLSVLVQCVKYSVTLDDPAGLSQAKGCGERVETTPALCEGLSESDLVGASPTVVERGWFVIGHVDRRWPFQG
jgi:hypothetical protein